VCSSDLPYAINWSKEHVPSILHVSQSSQETGTAIAEVIFGKVSPGGRLVQTWISSIDQLPPILDYNIRNGRTYMYKKDEPLFPFGFGLTYTKFIYSGLKAEKKSLKENEVVNLNFFLKNNGDFDSDEVAQLYVSFPDSRVDRPVISLKGFKRVFVGRGKTVGVSIPLKAADLTYWDIDKRTFILEKGTVKYFIGSSSEDIRLTGEIVINQ
jgi:beta-glucosidase